MQKKYERGLAKCESPFILDKTNFFKIRISTRN